jgi:hypothetical protein
VLELVVSSTVVVVVVEVGSTVVEVVGATVVVVGRTVEAVEVVTGLSPAVAAGRTRGRGRVVVEEAPPDRFCPHGATRPLRMRSFAA